ncbi:MAG TPA: hypothetical protein DCP91_00260 [Eggerthellaceae bacterium]|nr:hypothetical protein [Eggerthellaceae bacterium]
MQTLNRTKNTGRNIVWGFAAKAVSLLAPFVTRTFLIYRLGAEYLGISSLYTSVLTVLSLAELGFATAVVYGMYKPIAEGDVHQVAAYLNYLKVMYRYVGGVIVALGLAMLPLLGFLVRGEWPADVDMQIAFLIYLGNTAIGYFLFAYKQSLLNAYQRNDVVSRMNMVVQVIQCALQVAVLVLAPNFYAYALALPVCTVAGNILLAKATDRLLPEYSDRSLAKQRLETGRRVGMRRQVAGLVFTRICMVTRDSLDAVFISAFIGLSAVACYSNYFVIMNGLLGILLVFATSMTAAVGNSVAVETREKNFNDLRLFMFIYAAISIVIAACLLACFQPFMLIWVGEGLMLPFGVVVLLVAYFYVRTMGDMQWVYVDAAGLWWEQRWRTLAEVVANVVLNFALVQVWGIYGVVAGTLTSLFFIDFIYGSHVAFKFYFGLEKARAYYLDHAWYLAAAIAVCAATYLVAGIVPDGGFFWLAVKAAVSLLCSSALLVVVFCRTARFKRAVAFARRMLFPGPKKGSGSSDAHAD